MTSTASNVQTFNIDPSHSSVEFVVRHMVISKVRGRFGTFKGTIQIPEGSSVPSAIDVEIDASSIDTRESQRDAHLASPDFLHVEHHATITFVSANVSGGGPSFTIEGDLTIRGTTKRVRIDADVDGRAKDPWGNERVAFSGATKINRKDFGLNWNQALEAGGVLVGDEVTIELSVQAVRQ